LLDPLLPVARVKAPEVPDGLVTRLVTSAFEGLAIARGSESLDRILMGAAAAALRDELVERMELAAEDGRSVFEDAEDHYALGLQLLLQLELRFARLGSGVWPRLVRTGLGIPRTENVRDDEVALDLIGEVLEPLSEIEDLELAYARQWQAQARPA
jgi:hypothetical protein